MKKMWMKNKDAIFICACSLLLLFMLLILYGGIKKVKNMVIETGAEIEQLYTDLEDTQSAYSELEEGYQTLKQATDHERETMKQHLFGKSGREMAGELQIIDETGTADEDFNKNWKKEVSNDILQLIQDKGLKEAERITLTDRILFSADKTKAYISYMDEDKSRQVGIIYDSYYDNYLYFYQELSQDQEDDENSGRETQNDTNAGSSSSPVSSKAPSSTTVTTTTTSEPFAAEIQEDPEETNDPSGSFMFTVDYASQDILAYIDSQNISEQLEQFLRSSGYQGNLSCFIQEGFDVDNQNNYVMFSLLVNGGTSVSAAYNRNTGFYTFEIQ